MNPDGVTYRRFEPSDVPAAYAVFRRSLFDYLFRLGMVDSATALDPPIESAWVHQGPFVEHLVGTAAENWIAQDRFGTVIGWALSVDRDGVLELTHFFVEPGTQEKGVGRGLLERAFPQGRGRHRVIVATQDPRALGLYLRFGVDYVTTSMDLLHRPGPAEVRSDLEIARLAADEGSVALVGAIEEAVLGHRRDVDVRFLLRTRPAWVARRGGEAVGVAFGVVGLNSGPVAALDPADIPALLAHIENEAHLAGVEELTFSVPMVNRAAIDHLLARGFRIDPFYIKILADAPSMRLDRWIHTGPVFIV